MKKSVEKHRIYAKDYVGYWGYVSLRFLFCIMPARMAYGIAIFLGDVMFMCSKKNRNIIEGNLRNGLGLKEDLIRKHTRSIFLGFYMNLVDFLRFNSFDEKWFKENVEVIGIENLKKAFDKGKGVVAVTLHMGSWEITALTTVLAGFPTNGIWASHSNPKIEDFFLSPRIKKGIKVILTGGAIKKVLKALNANELVYFVIDHAYDGKGVECDFFGKKTVVPKGAAMSAISSKASVVPIVGVRGEGFLKYKFICGEQIDYSLSGDDKKDAEIIMSKCIKEMEKFVREYPNQWILFRNCWKA